MFIVHFYAVFLKLVACTPFSGLEKIEQCSNRRRNLVPDESGPMICIGMLYLITLEIPPFPLMSSNVT